MSRSKAGRILIPTWIALLVAILPGWWPAAEPTDQPVEFGPDVVVLNELEDAYEPVPFDHKSHAMMAQMWNGCITCHHHSPQPALLPVHGDTLTTHNLRLQDDADMIPACKSCHPILADESDISMPSLKGAYHRQCLNCHRDWMHENACDICHLPKDEQTSDLLKPSPGDIIGRMHPPIPAPEEVTYKTRFTPADGGNVLFRHREHAEDFGIRCVNCHRQDNCTHCHGNQSETSALKPLQPSLHWMESHGPCISCHNQARCQHCHFHDGLPAPARFKHESTGLKLDEDHEKLVCAQCHSNLGLRVSELTCAKCHENSGIKVMLTCGTAECHNGDLIEYPDQLPGTLVNIHRAGGMTTDTVQLPGGGE